MGYKVVAKNAEQRITRLIEKRRQFISGLGERLIEKRKRPTIGSGGRLTPKRILQEIIAAELASQELPSVALTTKQSRSETGCCAVCAANG